MYGARLLERAGISEVRVYVVGICWRWCKRVGITCVVCKSLGYKRRVYILRLYTHGYKLVGYKLVGYKVRGCKFAGCVLNPSKLGVGYQVISGLDGFQRDCGTHGICIKSCFRA